MSEAEGLEWKASKELDELIKAQSRASTMLLIALPEGQREERISSKKLMAEKKSYMPVTNGVSTR